MNRFKGYRKLLLGVLCILLGVLFRNYLTTHLLILFLGVYAIFCLCNCKEHSAEASISTATAPFNDSAILDGLSKILQYQESAMKALDFLVSYVNRAGQPH